MSSPIGGHRVARCLDEGSPLVRTYALEEEGDRPSRILRRSLQALEEGAPEAERFLLEADRAARVSHRALPAVEGFGLDDQYPYLVTVSPKGLPLTALLVELPEGELRVGLAALLAADLGATLRHLHEVAPPLVHGGLRPEAILLDREGRALLLDTGLGAAFEVALRAEPRIGAPWCPHRAPEHLLDRPLDPGTDLFLLGSCLYEALAGASPFEARTPMATCIQLRLGKHRPIEELVPEIPPRFAALIGGLLSPLSSERPGASEVALLGASLLADGRALAGAKAREALAEHVRAALGEDANTQIRLAIKPAWPLDPQPLDPQPLDLPSEERTLPASSPSHEVAVDAAVDTTVTDLPSVERPLPPPSDPFSADTVMDLPSVGQPVGWEEGEGRTVPELPAVAPSGSSQPGAKATQPLPSDAFHEVPTVPKAPDPRSPPLLAQDAAATEPPAGGRGLWIALGVAAALFLFGITLTLALIE